MPLGKIPPLHFISVGMTCRGVVPFNRTGYIRYVVMAMNHRRYIGYSVVRSGCSGGKSAAIYVVHLNLYQPTQKRLSFRPQRQRSGGIFPSCENYRRKVKSATWEDPSTPFHFGRDDMSGGGTVQPHGLYSLRCHGDESSPLHWVYRVLGDTIQPHRLYSERGGRQICRPYGHTGGWYHPSARIVIGTSPERHTGRSLRFR